MNHRAVVVLLAAFACADAADARAQVTLTTLHAFNGVTEGGVPEGRLIQASDGNVYGTTSVGGPRGGGTVFRIAPNGVVRIVSVLPGSDTAGVIQGSDGHLYGVTGGGSDARGNYAGLVFKVTLNGSYTELYRFPFLLTPDRASPKGELVEGSPGVFYGTTHTPLLDTVPGTAFRITSAGVYSKLQDLEGESSAGLVIGNDGNFYGTTFNSRGIPGSVFRVTPAGAYVTLHIFSGPDGSAPVTPLVLGNDGNFYGTTSGGGQFGQGTVFRITPGGALTTLHSFVGNSPAVGRGGAQPNALTLGSDGNLYGTTRLGGVVGRNPGAGTIFRITPGGSLTTLHTFDVLGNGGQSPIGGLVQASDGTFYGTTSRGGSGGWGTVFTFSLPGAPSLSAPTGLVASVSGSNVTLTWNASPGATFYRLGAGTTPGASNIFNGIIGNITNLTGVASAGTYHVRVHAGAPGGESGPSNEVTIVVGGCAPSSPPTGLLAAVTGRLVTLSWNAVSGAATYIIEAGSAPGTSNLANFATGNVLNSFRASDVPPGIYFVRIRTLSACGTSGASNEVMVSVGGS